ncbi:hypothetical protein [Nocardioides donggukensis]|uniref:Uncharacterized protein n=1 Tax=Nocardioides donggukensis TaxID=2774019 RepID=A0A927K5U1_9ACTN|nr:hypothetical protein [Nocardioides donggukensis]MBD8870471.1 hypothetical protein [Nocardioides donggukensis]
MLKCCGGAGALAGALLLLGTGCQASTEAGPTPGASGTPSVGQAAGQDEESTPGPAAPLPSGTGRAGLPDPPTTDSPSPRGTAPPEATGGEGTVLTSGTARLPRAPRADRRPLVSLPLPAAASGGGVVAGYPRPALSPVARSDALATSVSPARRSLQVGLSARSGRTPEGVLRHYRRRLAERGFREAPIVAVAGSEATVFRRGRDTVTITTRDAGSTTHYSLLATLWARRS